MIKLYLMIGSLFCMLSVMLGAFAAHGLKSRVSEYAIGIFKTAAEYQMVHGLALIAIAILIKWGMNLSWAGGFFLSNFACYLRALFKRFFQWRRNLLAELTKLFTFVGVWRFYT